MITILSCLRTLGASSVRSDRPRSSIENPAYEMLTSEKSFVCALKMSPIKTSSTADVDCRNPAIIPDDLFIPAIDSSSLSGSTLSNTNMRNITWKRWGRKRR